MGWRTKSVDQVQAESDRSELKRTLGPVHLVLFGIGCIIGAGISGYQFGAKAERRTNPGRR
jgi:amino acid permease